LVVAPQRGVDFPVFIEVRGDMPGAVVEVEEKDHAFAYVQEEADLAGASGYMLVGRMKGGEKEGLLCQMLITPSTILVRHTADGLAAHDLATEEAEGRIGELFAGCGAAASYRFVGEGVVVLWQTDELEDGGMRE
jgi:hypothetical protein